MVSYPVVTVRVSVRVRVGKALTVGIRASNKALYSLWRHSAPFIWDTYPVREEAELSAAKSVRECNPWRTTSQRISPRFVESIPVGDHHKKSMANTNVFNKYIFYLGVTQLKSSDKL